MKTSVICFSLAILASSIAPPALANPAEVIISREGKAVAVYFRMPFDKVAPLFGRAVPGLTDADGNIVLDDVFEGTFEDADLLAADVAFTLGGQSVSFDALSMMAHQSETPVPFATPLDAEIAIAVCGVPRPENIPAADQMVWLGGWHAYPVDASADLHISFPQTGRQGQEFVVTRFDDGVRTDRRQVTLVDGGTLEDAPPRGLLSMLFGG